MSWKGRKRLKKKKERKKMEVLSEEWWNETNALFLEVFPNIQTQPATSDMINGPPIMLPEATSLSGHPHQDVVEAPLMLPPSQTSKQCGIQVQSNKRKRITWTMEEHRYFYNINILFILLFL